MKREFGAKLIEQFLAQVDLQEVLDTSGAYIPGHGTPTVILVGRRRPPSTYTIRVVIPRKGEILSQLTAGGGPLWRSIVKHVDESDFMDDWVEVVDVDRSRLASHPWSLGGSRAQEVKRAIEVAAASTLRYETLRIGFFGITGADEMMLAPPRALARLGIHPNAQRRHVAGEDVRDWMLVAAEVVFLPVHRCRRSCGP